MPQFNTADDNILRFNPLELFKNWYEEAIVSEPEDPNAMSLATVDEDGRPSVRIVLLKEFGEAGFIFYTHRPSRKGKALLARPFAALCLHWKSLRRQIRLEGPVQEVPESMADDYFATRPRLNQLGAWASRQSEILPSAGEFEQRLEEVTRKFEGQKVPRPPYWTGFSLMPDSIEFWQQQPNRWHQRVIFTKTKTGWDSTRLYP
ncbi:MAG: pyridoxamine 5'-phosphate oxidase [Dongiaceae bacterium]